VTRAILDVPNVALERASAQFKEAACYLDVRSWIAASDVIYLAIGSILERVEYTGGMILGM
jgi:hypothetical protein